MRNSKRMILFLLIQAITSTALSQPMCSDLFLPARTRLSNLGEGFPRVFDRIRELPTDLVSGKKTPNWHDLNHLEVLLKDVRLAKKALDTPEKQAELESIVAQVARGIDQDPQLSDLSTAYRTHVASDKYAPTEYELKLAYQYMLGKINRELPRNARIPLQRLPLDQRRQRINQEAREFMVEFEKSFESRFSTTGFKTYEEYEAAVRSSTDPLVQKAVEMIDKGQIEVVIRRPEKGRFWVPKAGFQNQYVSGSSRGSLNPKGRMEAESNLYDIQDVEAYSKLDRELMPKYGTFRPSPESGVSYDRAGSYQYGEDFYVVRLSDIQDRLTWTPGDSLGVGWGSPATTKWNQSFIPWKYRLLMVEFMKESLKANEMSVPVSSSESPMKSHRFSICYWEVQVLGAVELKNITSFDFTKNPPSGQFLLDLLDRNIPIRNASTWPPVEWKPSEEDIRQAKENR